jgi:glycerol-3-phosphate dehydrogenase (NAD(P)+)
MQLGANALAAMITRGLAEMMRLGVHCGADPHTLMGLAGMGDLVLSCTDNQSRNRRYGFLRAQGKNHAEALATIGHVVEGTFAAQYALALAQKHKIELPITEMVGRFVEEKISAEDALKALFGRDPKAE